MADECSPDTAPISTEFHSVHVESLRTALETLDVSDEQAKVQVEIEASKVHWSEPVSSYYTGVEGPAMDLSSTSLKKWVHEEGTPEWKLEVAEDNVRVFRSLQEKYSSGFFFDENDVGPTSTQRFPKWMLRDDGTPALEVGLSSETPFAEGGQAKLFHAYVIDLEDGEKYGHLVMKVFKEGTPLRDLLKLLPTTMLTSDEACHLGFFGDLDYSFNTIGGARLLKSSRQFAFLMLRAWGDLRKLIDERMLHFNIQGLPFSNDVAFFILYIIAKGMMKLHERDIIHRDLKAANVLVFAPMFDVDFPPYIIDPFDLQPYGFNCLVANFECSVGIVGTRFWRAPEILVAVMDQSISKKPELFTKQSDVYSFGMTCYEVLSSAMPFEQLRANNFDGVICGARPALPSRTPPWMVDLVNRCWHQDPSMRPPFEEIVEILEPYVSKKEK